MSVFDLLPRRKRTSCLAVGRRHLSPPEGSGSGPPISAGRRRVFPALAVPGAKKQDGKDVCRQVVPFPPHGEVTLSRRSARRTPLLLAVPCRPPSRSRSWFAGKDPESGCGVRFPLTSAAVR